MPRDQCFSCGAHHASLAKYQVVAPPHNDSGDTDVLCRSCAKDYRRGGFTVRFLENVKMATEVLRS